MARERRGCVQVYTGNGKGKTTAAIGLTVRALGAGHKVAFIQFMKSLGYSEHRLFENLSPNLTHFTVGKPFFVAKKGSVSEEDLAKIALDCVVFPPGAPPEEYMDLVAGGLGRAAEILAGGQCDLVVLDELNCALHFELIDWNAVERALDGRHFKTEVVLTGRGAPEALLAKADLVTEMVEIKHYYNQGLMARRGIEN
ncbi:MAG: cob(I)yrinic acid a,c-diamide adenosyltransferase [Candidatus Adiutrix sp.]|jgi:cob(I)alamin adenosyltransferase|nr:cob(I)yrinic acid a,c-diamide adenosyltransferase [Candidatus Adiutrix sp.]